MKLVEIEKGDSINPEMVIRVRQEKLKLPIEPGRKTKCKTKDKDHPKDTEGLCPHCDSYRYKDGVIIYLNRKVAGVDYLISPLTYEETKLLLTTAVKK